MRVQHAEQRGSFSPRGKRSSAIATGVGRRVDSGAIRCPAVIAAEAVVVGRISWPRRTGQKDTLADRLRFRLGPRGPSGVRAHAARASKANVGVVSPVPRMMMVRGIPADPISRLN